MLKAESELRSLSAIDSGVEVVVGVNHMPCTVLAPLRVATFHG